MIPKWKKSKLVGGRKIFLYFQKGIINKRGKKSAKVQIRINGADRDFSLC